MKKRVFFLILNIITKFHGKSQENDEFGLRQPGSGSDAKREIPPVAQIEYLVLKIQRANSIQNEHY